MDVFKETLERVLKETENETDPVKRVKKAFNEASIAMVKTFPIWMKFNYIANITRGLKDSEVNWEMVNELLNARGPFEFNRFEYIKSREKLFLARNIEFDNSLLDGPYVEFKCSKCGDVFYLTKREAEFYEEQGFKAPKQCKYCKKGIKKPVIPVVKEKTPEEIAEEKKPINSMSYALNKAGLLN